MSSEFLTIFISSYMSVEFPLTQDRMEYVRRVSSQLFSYFLALLCIVDCTQKCTNTICSHYKARVEDCGPKLNFFIKTSETLSLLSPLQDQGQRPLGGGELIQPVGDDSGEQVPVPTDGPDSGARQVGVTHCERLPLPRHRGSRQRRPAPHTRASCLPG